MSDIKLPPNMPPPTPSVKLTATQATSQTPVTPTPPPAIIQAVVRETPAPIRQQQKPVHTEGKVTSSDPAAHRMTISTPEGDVVVETDTPLPPETEVTVDIYVQGSVEKARIAVTPPQETPRAEAPPPQDIPPPLKEGDIVTALVLPEETPVQESENTPPTPSKYPDTAYPSTPVYADTTDIEQPSPPQETLPRTQSLPLEPLIAALTSLTSNPVALAGLLQKIPDVMSIPVSLKEVMTAKNPRQSLSALPPLQTQEIWQFISQTAVQNTLSNILPQHVFSPLKETLAQFSQNTTSIPFVPKHSIETDSIGLSSNTTRPHMETNAIPTQAPSAPSPLSALLQAMLPSMATPSSHEVPLQNIPVFANQQAFRQLQASDIGAPQNMISLRIVKIIPPTISSSETITKPSTLPSAASPLISLANQTAGIKNDSSNNSTTQPSAPQSSNQPSPHLKRGTVEMTTPKGFPIINTDIGHIVLRTPTTIADGSTVIFEPSVMTVDDILRDNQTLSSLPLGIGQQAAPFSPLLSTFWPAMQDTLTTLDTAARAAEISGNPAAAVVAAANTLRDTLPSPSPRMVPTALFFLAALRIGAVENWLGQNTLQALKESGRKDLAEKLGGDFKSTATQSRDTLSGDWRAISMPLLHDDQLSQLHFYVRRQGSDENDKNNDSGGSVTRFLVNFNLSRMGDLQLDGLLRSKKFDLVLRTDAALPADMRQELAQAFRKGLDQTGMQGGISFQTRAQSWVNVPLPLQSGTFV